MPFVTQLSVRHRIKNSRHEDTWQSLPQSFLWTCSTERPDQNRLRPRLPPFESHSACPPVVSRVNCCSLGLAVTNLDRDSKIISIFDPGNQEEDPHLQLFANPLMELNQRDKYHVLHPPPVS